MGFIRPTLTLVAGACMVPATTPSVPATIQAVIVTMRVGTPINRAVISLLAVPRTANPNFVVCNMRKSPAITAMPTTIFRIALYEMDAPPIAKSPRGIKRGTLSEYIPKSIGARPRKTMMRARVMISLPTWETRLARRTTRKSTRKPISMEQAMPPMSPNHSGTWSLFTSQATAKVPNMLIVPCAKWITKLVRKMIIMPSAVRA
ncbi:MAG: hypothetical protein FWF10_07515 [Clostridiales bacterium]|nr:hypothetical protein [Clostridiales bacterium]